MSNIYIVVKIISINIKVLEELRLGLKRNFISCISNSYVIIIL